ncbi:hypothetical protein DVH24_017872 [Malus domestica]|uniref:Uncharacterized protein n=1 Tax=Malus domestica TaxID=3750 RepID=A0A498KBW4_MALDO|nr:hypothetical protein DVH24_017872 [Malus domestica]
MIFYSIYTKAQRMGILLLPFERRVVGLFFPAVFRGGIATIWVRWLLCAVILCLIGNVYLPTLGFFCGSLQTLSGPEPLERGLAEDIENVYKLQCSFLHCSERLKENVLLWDIPCSSNYTNEALG